MYSEANTMFSSKFGKNQSTVQQLVIVLFISLLSLNCGLNFGWPSPSVLDLLSEDSEFELDYELISYIIMLCPFAICIGSPIGGLLMNRIGRKYTLLFLAVLQILSWICIGVSSYVIMLFAGRILAGVSDGVFVTSLPVYVCEILQPHVRGYLGSLPTVSICLGALIINIYGSFVSVRIAAYISISFPSLFIILFVTIPESPYYLMMKNRSEDARDSLKKLRNADEVESELAKIAIDVHKQMSESGGIKEVFTVRSNLRAFLILLLVRLMQQFSGVTAVSYYTHFIFKRAGGKMSPATSAIICSTTKLISVGLGSILVEKSGRRSLYLWSTFGSGVFLVVLGLYFYFENQLEDTSPLRWLPIVAMLAYVMVNSAGVIIVPNLIMGELLPIQIKAVALSTINVCGGIATALSSKFFQLLDHSFGMYTPFFAFSVFCFAGVHMIYSCVPETKGKTLDEIQQFLKNTHGRKVKTPHKIYTTKL